MRLYISILASVAVALAATTASAFTITPTVNQVGSQVTIDVDLSNDGQALGAVTIAALYDPAALQFVSGEAAASSFNTQLAFGIAPDGGIPNTAGVELASSIQFVPGNRALSPTVPGEILAMDGLLFPTQTAPGSSQFDLGVGQVSAETAPYIRLVFEVIGNLPTDVQIGPVPGDIGSIVLADGTDIGTVANATVTVVPEPGTALLMGLGLSGLAMAGRRR